MTGLPSKSTRGCASKHTLRGLPSIGTVHKSNFPRNLWPLELALDSLGIPTSLLEVFLPFEQFIRETQVRLDDDVETPSADEAVRPRHGHVECFHDLCNTNGCASGHAHAAVDEGGGSSSTASFWNMSVSVTVANRQGVSAYQ